VPHEIKRDDKRSTLNLRGSSCLRPVSAWISDTYLTRTESRCQFPSSNQTDHHQAPKFSVRLILVAFPEPSRGNTPRGRTCFCEKRTTGRRRLHQVCLRQLVCLKHPPLTFTSSLFFSCLPLMAVMRPMMVICPTVT
jgi:hypothetical protein